MFTHVSDSGHVNTSSLQINSLYMYSKHLSCQLHPPLLPGNHVFRAIIPITDYFHMHKHNVGTYTPFLLGTNWSHIEAVITFLGQNPNAALLKIVVDYTTNSVGNTS